MFHFPDPDLRVQVEIARIKSGAVGFSFDANVHNLAYKLICSRQNISPKRLLEPGPSAFEIERLLGAAAAAPDHGMLTPWRFIIVPADKRPLLGEAFALALTDRDDNATLEQIASARAKADRAPFLMLAVARLADADPCIPEMERLVSLGGALQNILLCAHSMGYGTGLTSGQAMNSARIRMLFALSDDEQSICCINIGTVKMRKPQRTRPDPWTFTSTL
jgi:nitroreductase